MRITRYQLLALVSRSFAVSPELGAQAEPALIVGVSDRDEMLRWIRASTTPQRVVMRSVIVLLAAAGWSNSRSAGELGIGRRTVALWKHRFQVAGCRALLVDSPGRGRKPGRNRHVVQQIVAMHRQGPPQGARWTVRSLAREVGSSHATVQRVLRELDLGSGLAMSSQFK
jgi:transposase